MLETLQVHLAALGQTAARCRQASLPLLGCMLWVVCCCSSACRVCTAGCANSCTDPATGALTITTRLTCADQNGMCTAGSAQTVRQLLLHQHGVFEFPCCMT